MHEYEFRLVVRHASQSFFTAPLDIGLCSLPTDCGLRQTPFPIQEWYVGNQRNFKTRKFQKKK